MVCFIYSLVVRTTQSAIVTFFAGVIGIGLILLNSALFRRPKTPEEDITKGSIPLPYVFPYSLPVNPYYSKEGDCAINQPKLARYLIKYA